MKSKKMFLSLVAIIFSIFIGYNIYSVENSQQTFDVSFLNIEALASGESSGARQEVWRPLLQPLPEVHNSLKVELSPIPTK